MSWWRLEELLLKGFSDLCPAVGLFVICWLVVRELFVARRPGDSPLGKIPLKV